MARKRKEEELPRQHGINRQELHLRITQETIRALMRQGASPSVAPSRAQKLLGGLRAAYRETPDGADGGSAMDMELLALLPGAIERVAGRARSLDAVLYPEGVMALDQGCLLYMAERHTPGFAPAVARRGKDAFFHALRTLITALVRHYGGKDNEEHAGAIHAEIHAAMLKLVQQRKDAGFRVRIRSEIDQQFLGWFTSPQQRNTGTRLEEMVAAYVHAWVGIEYLCTSPNRQAWHQLEAHLRTSRDRAAENFYERISALADIAFQIPGSWND